MDTAVSLLVIDDESLIAEMVKEVLEEGGFEVIVAHSSEEAMAAIDAKGATGLAGLVTDVNLGSTITGWDIARRARELRPDLPIVYTSGYAADDWPVQGVPHSLIVRKPFAPAQIVTAISTLITEASSQPGATA
ncbi:MAG TPA: response regulator [Sphingomicrobium sp.]|nr:response regulator [Sphingomicrobium sp.]